MATKAEAVPKIYKAEAPASTNGAVLWGGSPLSLEEAISHRKSGGNVVVRGSDKKENLRLAQQIEDGVGPWERDKPHKNRAGRSALPHFHQKPGPDGRRTPAGHTFYEVEKSKARKKP